MSNLDDQQAILDTIPFAEETESTSYPEEPTPIPEEPEPLPEATNGTVLDTLNNDEALFNEGPTRSEVEELKKKYPNSDIMCSLLANGKGILFRTMTRMEWKAVQSLVRSIPDPDKKEEVIFSKVVLFPDCSDQTVINKLPAGVVTNVLNEFYMFSGFTSVSEALKL